MSEKIRSEKLEQSKIEQLVNTIARLRSENGCPWDKEQTHASLAPFLLEEVYEVLEAIHLEKDDKLEEELGDLLLQIVMHSQIASEAKIFDFNAVAQSINDKMIRRHPHVFADATAQTPEAVIAQWQELKERELKEVNQSENDADGKADRSALDGVPSVMPALLKALKISQKAVGQGFDWTSESGIWDQLSSELTELKEAIADFEAHKDTNEALNSKSTTMPINEKKAAFLQALKLELGDVLFTIVNLARWHQLDPEEALLLACEKFKRRFQAMEKLSQRPLKELSIEELEQLWQRVKSKMA